MNKSTDPSAELVEVVRPDGSVLDIATRAEMRSQNLAHRSVYVMVLTGDSSTLSLVTHQRSPAKDYNPDFWDVAFGGVCDVGEEWLDAAERELAEEAGISGQTLTFLGGGFYQNEDLAVVGHVYGLKYDGPITFTDGEVQRSQRVPLQEIGEWFENRQVCADSMALVIPKIPEFVKTIQGSEI